MFVKYVGEWRVGDHVASVAENVRSWYVNALSRHGFNSKMGKCTKLKNLKCVHGQKW